MSLVLQINVKFGKYSVISVKFIHNAVKSLVNAHILLKISFQCIFESTSASAAGVYIVLYGAFAQM